MRNEWLRNNRWTLACLLWMCGLTVLFAFFVTDPDDRLGLLSYNILFTLLFSGFCLGMSGWVKKGVLILFALLAWIPSLIETGWFIMDQSLLIRTQWWVVFDTNPAEASGLLSMVKGWQWGLLALYAAISLGLLIMALRENHKLPPLVSLGAACLAASLILIPGVRYNVPCVNFYNSYRGYRMDLKQAQNFMNTRQDLTGQVNNLFPDSTAAIVVMIGESLSRRHCSLYGYCRPTTPRLDQRHDLTVYQHVRSSDYMTQPVMQMLLSFADSSHPEARWNSPTLPEVLNAAGWDTYWFDPYEGRNNTSNALPTGFQSIAKLCHVYHLGDENEQYDEAHWAHLESALSDSTSKRKAVFLHLIGNHFPYDRRYPSSFVWFDDAEVCSPFADQLSASQVKVINDYDNAVRYNDEVVDSVVNRLSRLPYACAMLYFPDHGEEIFDEDFYAGRSFNHVTPTLYEIPCVLWQNDTFAARHPLRIDTEKPYCTDRMIHSLLDLFAVDYALKDTTYSLFR